MYLKKALKALKMPKLLSILLSVIILVSVFTVGNYSFSAQAVNGVGLTFDLNKGGKVIQNKFSDLNVWDLNTSWTTDADSQPTDYFSSEYPFIKRVQLMTATGGVAGRDLFKNPNDRTTLTDYKFDTLIKACHNIINQGAMPNIITGNVPLKLCSNPVISKDFGVNVMPPDDYNQYYTYIKAIADALVKEFGIDEVKKWSWGVLTEYENSSWFESVDGTALNSEKEYFKLYDYTVSALQASIGADNLVVGAHGMVCISGLWDVRHFIYHCAYGTNYKTGAKGTQINYLTASYYDTEPGKLAAITLDDCINILKDEAAKDGLTNIKFGIDEGRILNGTDGKPLGTREVAMSYQGAANAKQFKDMIVNDIDWFATWGLNTSVIWGGIDVVGTHVANLGYKMTGDNYIEPVKSGSTPTAGDAVDGIGGYNSDTKTAHFMIYNYNKNPDATVSEPTTVVLNNVGQIDGSTVTVKQWIVDDTHSNFWPAWWKDQQQRGLTDIAYNWSKYSVNIPSQLVNTSDKNFWQSREDTYRNLADLKAVYTDYTVTDGSITLSANLANHGVVFYEVTQKQEHPVETQETAYTDDLNDWTHVASHTDGLIIDTLNGDLLGDTSRACRNDTKASPAESIVYNIKNTTKFNVTGLYAIGAGYGAIDNFKFYTSVDGTNWTQQAASTYRDSYVNGESWIKRVYYINSVPSGTNYVKVEFPVSGAYAWNPQLSQAVITTSDAPSSSSSSVSSSSAVSSSSSAVSFSSKVSDTTAPIVTGVTNGGVYYTSVNIYFNEGTAKLNGISFANGGTVSGAKNYTLVVTDAAGNTKTVNFKITAVSVSYQAQVQRLGWLNAVTDGALCGTSGMALRMEAVKIKLVNAPAGLSVQYRGHVQSIGWQGWVSDGALAGTVGKGLRIEAFQIRLVGANADKFTIQYQAHVQSIGWQNWVSDGAVAGTSGRALRVEALKIRIVPKS